MKVTVMGCGNAFSTKNFNQMFLLEETNGNETRKMLVDCGYQAQACFLHHKMSIADIDVIYVSHLHADHIGGLEWTAFSRYDWFTKPKPRNWRDFKKTKAPVLACETGLLTNLWDKSLRGGLESMEGFVANLETFFQPKPVDIEAGFDWMGWHFELVQQIHIMSGSKIADTFGLFITQPNHKKLYLTTDSQHCSPSQVEDFYERADIIVQDCEILPFTSNVHAPYVALAGHPDANARKLSESIRSKMWLSHYQDFYNLGLKPVSEFSPFSLYKPSGKELVVSDFGITGEPFDWDQQAKTDGFAGFVKVGQTFEI